MYSFVSLTWPATAVAMGKRKADDSKEKEEPEKEIESERRKTRAKQPAPRNLRHPRNPRGNNIHPERMSKGKKRYLRIKQRKPR